MSQQPKKPEVDITLLVEGTFPYVTGGVSSWIYQILCSFPQYRFGIIFIGSVPEDYGEPRYRLPDNLVHLESHFLFTSDDIQQTAKHRAHPKQLFDDILQVHEKFKSMKDTAIESILADLHHQLFSPSALTRDQFLYSKSAWDYMTQKYESQAPDISFIDYFWSVRNMHTPLWKLIEIAQLAPPTKILHSATTGYAGLLGALLHNLRGCPYVLTEHGIYTKERRIDLLQSEWSAYTNAESWGDVKTTHYLSDLWIRFFETLARMSYSAANPIISLFETYQQRQIKDGAPQARTRVIANGIELDTFKAPARKGVNPDRPIICFLGRVIQIKDVKTFIRAVAIIMQHIPNAEAWIVGSTEDTEEYAEECQNLITMLHLKEKILFLGKRVTQEILPQVDLLILSSISEGLPFVILEGFAAGVPSVSTDVGACRELIYGKSEEDKLLGKSGEIVGIANPKELAQAALTLLQDPKLWQAASDAGLKRVAKYYDLRNIMGEYATIYREAIDTWQG